jgi:hypothetical protein
MQEFLSNHRQFYPEYFEGTSKKRVREHIALTPAQMADQIVTGKEFVKGLYECYFRLSQFEHFTVVTESFMNDPDHNADMMYIVDVTNYLLDLLNINLSTLGIPEEFREGAVELINGFRSIKWRVDGPNKVDGA